MADADERLVELRREIADLRRRNRELESSLAAKVDRQGNGERSTRRGKSALRDSEQRYRTLFEASPDATYVHVDDRVVFANAAAARLLGFTSAAELLGATAMSLYHPREHAGIRAYRARVKRQGIENSPTTTNERRFVRRDGTEFDGEVLATPLTWESQQATLLIVRDVSARKLADNLLRESEACYRQLFEASPDAIILHVDDRIVFANPAAVRMFGFASTEDLVGRSALSLRHEQHHDQIRRWRLQLRAGTVLADIQA
jgi:PAS domain S-box-containing protein